VHVALDYNKANVFNKSVGTNLMQMPGGFTGSQEKG
jgi:hypothetical protein